MKIISSKKRKNSDVLIIPFWEKANKAEPALSVSSFRKWIDTPLRRRDFTGRKNESCLIYPQRQREKRFLLLGLGKKEEASLEDIRQSYGEAVKVCHRKKLHAVSLLFPEKIKFEKIKLLKAAVEGACLSNYVFDKYQKKKTSLVKTFYLIGCSTKEHQAVKDFPQIAEGVFLARDLVCENADVITPQKLAEVANDMQKLSTKLKVRIFKKKDIEKLKMNLLLAVNQGAKSHPVFIEMNYSNNPSSKDRTVIIGKGITYDSGGLCLKPADSMLTMKDDMAGAAAIMGTMYTLLKLKPKINVTALIPSTENAIGPNSYKPGDVFSSMSGKTVEIVNTDAEGRLILADALCYAVEKIKPKRIVNLATLTGAIIIALGEEISGLFTNDDKIARSLKEAAKKTGEALWRLPLPSQYLQLLKSDIAEIRNCGSRAAGSITAGLFLKQFVKKTPWAHIDIAGTSWQKKAKGYNPSQGTGVGVRLLVQWLEELLEKK